jgi:hypothetical protein
VENIVLGIVLKRRVNNMSFVYDWKVKNGDDVKVEYCWSSVDNCTKVVEMSVNGKFHRETWMSPEGREKMHKLLTDDYMNMNGILSQDFYQEEEAV